MTDAARAGWPGALGLPRAATWAWLVAWALGREPAVAMDAWTDGLVMLRYDDAVFVQKSEIG